MKQEKLMMAVVIAMAMAACEKENVSTVVINEPAEMQEKTITFSVGNGGGTRATLTELSLTDLWLFDYVGGELQQTVHVGSTDGGFGSLSLSMEYGDHNLYFVASRGTTPTVSAPTIAWEKPSDTFWKALELTVAPATSANQAVELKRVATRLRIAVTDEVPTGASQLKVAMSNWYSAMDVRTGAGVNVASVEKSVTIPSSYIGTSDKLVASFFGLSASEEWTTDVTVTMTGENDAVMGSVALSDVSFAQNRTTVYSGGILGGVGTMTVTADDAWGAENVQTW